MHNTGTWLKHYARTNVATYPVDKFQPQNQIFIRVSYAYYQPGAVRMLNNLSIYRIPRSFLSRFVKSVYFPIYPPRNHFASGQ